MGDLEHQRRFVSAGSAAIVIADDGEPGDVVLVVFDPLGDHVQSVIRRRLQAGDGRGSRFFRCQLSGGGRAGQLDQPRQGHVLGQPVAALRQGLRLAVDLLDVSSFAAAE
jgi:hypothetical protein